MSDIKPEKKTKEKDKVIDLVHGAEESSGERLLKKHIPAWVISGALHVAISLTLLMVFKFFVPPVQAKAPPEDVAVAAEDQPEPPPPSEDLTKTDPGLESTIETSLPNDREEKVNVDEQVQMSEPIGSTMATENTSQDSLKALGAPLDLTAGGSPLEGVGAGAIGDGGMGGLVNGNPALVGRSGSTKNKLLEQYGGSKESELAVGLGLAWLAKQQRQDGSWIFDGSSPEEVAGATGLALLPFLAAGQTHIIKKDQDNKYARTIKTGLDALIRLQQKDGSFKGGGHGKMYSHGIATVALCEALGMTSDRTLLRDPAQKAVNYIMSAQGGDGGWRYAPKQDGDTSVVGWMLQALQSAKLCKDLVVSKAAFDGGRKFLDKAASGSKKETYGYTGPGSSANMTAVGLLCRYYIDGWNANNPGMAAGVSFLKRSLMPDSPGGLNMYYFYYATQVFHFYEGDEWHKEWNPKMRDRLIRLQVQDKSKTKDYGSWDRDSSQIGSHCGRLGTTCFCLLTLEVYYRHTPLNRRDSGGLKELERGK
jgi:hypothetical protein